MPKIKFILLFFIAIFLGEATTLNALIIANPRISFDPLQTIEIGYEQGSIPVFAKHKYYREKINSGKPIKFQTKRLYVQTNKDISKSLSLFYRLIKDTPITTFDYEGNQKDSNYFGVGFGFQIIATEIVRSLNLNFTGSFDFNYLNSRYLYPSRNKSVDWAKGILAAWLSYQINQNLDIYCGITQLTSNFQEDFLKDDNPWLNAKKTGGFLGSKFLCNKHFSVIYELHIINENTSDLLLIYKF